MGRRVSRRSAIKAISTSVAAISVSNPAAAQTSTTAISTDELATLHAIAEVVLPRELGPEARRGIVSGFVRWIRTYKDGADTDHGYGVTRIRRTGPSPALVYAAQMTALQSAAGGAFQTLSVDARRPLVEAALTAAGVDRLPSRPNGGHVISDLMAFYFNSPAATDLCYRAAIGRHDCRGLPNSDKAPEPLQ
jgi:hypothetical protein